MHKWYNPSETEPARLIATLLPAEPFEIDGKQIEEILPSPSISSN